MRTLVVALAILVTACGSVPSSLACLGPSSLPPPVVATRGDCHTALALDRTTLTSGQRLVFTLTTTATGPACGVGVPCGGLDVQVFDSAGNLRWRPRNGAIACRALARMLRQGESISATATWDHTDLGGGTYAAVSGGAATYFRVC